MKRLLITLLVAVGFVAYTNAQNKTVTLQNDAVAKIEFKSTEHNFGDVKQGKPVTAKFVFTNTGNAPLVLTPPKPSCGCTTASYTKEPIPPGGTGEVVATYNAASPGTFQKSVAVRYNGAEGDNAVFLYLKGNVVATPQESAPPVQVAP
ncbi:MAG: DUF1573 domain-containing protein [Flavobacteriales bacterium]|nr:DUF1573 domain-containing protein [Flavobacteriales bacterium]